MAWLGRWWVLVSVLAACGSTVDDDTKVGSGDGSGEGEDTCVGPPPQCPFVGADCSDAPPDAVCVAGEWSCPRAGLVVPGVACSEAEGTYEEEGPVPGCDGEETPPDCWDQGPGECSDAAQPATCDGEAWVCPPGWALGGFGEGCDWPSPEGATLESSGSEGGTSTGTSSGSDTGSSDTSTTTGGEVDDATFTAG
jgi:hypothetical protein